VIEPFERAVGRRVLGNRVASGTAILDELGPEHLATGRPIVYTSADSVLQVAAHEEVVPVETLYAWCEAARRILVPPHAVGRVIARPFLGRPGAFARTPRRRDWSVPPPGPTLLDRLVAAGRRVHGVGKIEDIFAGRGVTSAVHTESDEDGLERTVEALRADPLRSELRPDLVFTNLVDFDSKYGHRNDPAGYARALESFDRGLPALEAALREDDLLFLTADHGNDPSDVSTDHTREHVPVVVAGPRVRPGAAIGTRATFRDLGATVGEHLGVAAPGGASFLGLATG
jgi:phosphopentomutase